MSDIYTNPPATTGYYNIFLWKNTVYKLTHQLKYAMIVNQKQL